jgi:hypothetical protein
MRRFLAVLLATLSLPMSVPTFAQDTPAAAQKFGRERKAVSVQPDGLYICEAEEFQAVSNDKSKSGWQAKRFGENYYAATFANSFLSRQAFLGAPEQCEETVASLNVDIKTAGRYLVLVRYEAAYLFETQFRVQVEQNGKLVLNRLYGARKNLKIWAFSQKLKTEVGWSWGAVENIVWEGHDSFASLKPGRATIRLIAAKQPEPAAKRNIDLVMLTTDVEQVKNRIEKEKYLPLDGMLTQSGDVFLKVTNLGKEQLTFSGGRAIGGGNWQQHSPYWVHMRSWKAPTISVAPGKTSGWVEVGGTMDSLSDGQWTWTGNGKYKAEFGLREPNGSIATLSTFTGEGALKLAADGDTRYSRRLRRQEDVLYELLAYLKKENPAPHGKAPKRTTIYASTFTALDQGKHKAAVAEFKKLFSLSDTTPEASGGRGYIDVRSVATPKLEAYCQNLAKHAKNIAVVSLGDEIRLPTPRGKDVNSQFHAWLKSRKIQPKDVLPSAANWAAISWNVSAALKETQPGVYYWSKRYQYDFGIRTIKQRTDILRKHFPNAGIGANYSPHYPSEHMFLGEVFKWVSVFRDSAMTLPWSEDYIWQLAVGTPQMNGINLDLFRAANRHHPDRKILYYVMPHMPNNTPRQWRRLFYGALGHGMKIVNLFEFRPVHVAYTENHVDEPAMYREVLKSFRELGLFEDIVQDGKVRPAKVALWFSETADIWGDSHGSFAAGKRSLYTAIRHQQIPLDFVVEQDAIDGTLGQYRVLYLTDAHVSQAASKKIADWVQSGGQLFATAGAGMFDELNRPNEVLRKVLGVTQTKLDVPEGKQLIWLKQHLPFASPIATVKAGQDNIPVFGVRSRVTLTGAEKISEFSDGSPAVTFHSSGRGKATYCAYLPGPSYYHPAIPKRPVDRGATDDAMVHFLPTEFDRNVAALISSPVNSSGAVSLPIVCSEPLVETTIIDSPNGSLVTLVNWSGKPIDELTIEISASVPGGKITLAGGAKVAVERKNGRVVATMKCGAADALIIRK